MDRVLKAPPVMKIIRRAWPGSIRNSSSYKSMPVSPGIIKSQRTTSNLAPVLRSSSASRADSEVVSV
jgi:hypothetical protein